MIYSPWMSRGVFQFEPSRESSGNARLIQPRGFLFMKLIPLTQGQFAKVDDDDFERISKFKWCSSFEVYRFYAVRGGWVDGKTVAIRMHRVIMNAKRGQYVDHINHDGLDNRRTNLRICTNGENMRNRSGPQKNSTSGILGVRWRKDRSKWESRMCVNGKNMSLGHFENKHDATRAYAEARLKYFSDSKVSPC